MEGVEDCGDGVGIEVTRERRMEVMRDSGLGTGGGAALFCNLAFKGGALVIMAADGSGN